MKAEMVEDLCIRFRSAVDTLQRAYHRCPQYSPQRYGISSLDPLTAQFQLKGIKRVREMLDEIETVLQPIADEYIPASIGVELQDGEPRKSFSQPLSDDPTGEDICAFVGDD